MARRIKVVQYNVWKSKNVDAIIDFLREQDPDIVTLQEVKASTAARDVYMGAFRRLCEELDLHGVHAPTIFTQEEENTTQGNAILSRWPILGNEVTFLSEQLMHESDYGGDWQKEPRVALKVELDIEGTKLNVFTTHLTFNPDFKPSDLQRWQAQRLARVLQREISTPLIFGGDLNTTPDTEIAEIVCKGLNNVLEGSTAKTFAKHRFEFKGFVVDRPTYLIDFMLVSNAITPIDVEVIDLDASDHLPVVAHLEL